MATKKTSFNIVQIKTVNEFIDEVTKFRTGRTKVWYRGHSENNYKLEPSIYRQPFTPAAEQELYSQFKSRAISYVKNVPTGSNEYWEWLFLMQHYKLPTRLLDWTESALVALAFAVIFRDNEKKREKAEEGAHIWCLDAKMLNSKFNWLENVIPNITENPHAQEICRRDYVPTQGTMSLPVAVYGPQNNPRIVGQKGVFTVFPARENFQFDDYIGSMGTKLIIKSDVNVRKISNELFALGVSESMIYPELDSISSEIKREYILSKR